MKTQGYSSQHGPFHAMRSIFLENHSRRENCFPARFKVSGDFIEIVLNFFRSIKFLEDFHLFFCKTEHEKKERKRIYKGCFEVNLILLKILSLTSLGSLLRNSIASSSKITSYTKNHNPNLFRASASVRNLPFLILSRAFSIALIVSLLLQN